MTFGLAAFYQDARRPSSYSRNCRECHNAANAAKRREKNGWKPRGTQKLPTVTLPTVIEAIGGWRGPVNRERPMRWAA